jgi:hypothetical protein
MGANFEPVPAVQSLGNRMRPCDLYRDAVRDLLFRHVQAPGKTADQDLYDTLQRIYEECCGVPHDRAGRFVAAAALFTFGRLDVAEDILDNIPEGRGSVRRLAWALQALMSVPEGMDALKNPDAMREWLRENAGNLRWDEDAGRYLPKC